ncbi:MAG TPA: alpha-L-arabinofuranosidase C-terminal domain-containing protein [Flavitalea sp.]|nr:alpha-L-arabinofuranosidase C-terminal domain-containing protein [Flavitalea sp.]
MKRIFVVVICCVLLAAYTTAQNNNAIVVKANQVVATVQPTMWGVFFEDINMGADGGLYAELIKNRSFEFYKPLMGWKILGRPQTEGDFIIQNRNQINLANPRFLRITLHHNSKGSIGLSNEGFRGMGIKNGLRYDFSVMYRRSAGDNIKMHIELIDSTGRNLGGTALTIPVSGNEWKKLSVSFNATATEPKAKFNIWLEGDGVVDLDMTSLFPSDTWKNRPGGMRADMIQLLADLKPGFIRFPGGCIVEGYDLSLRYQWKKTIGPLEDRQLLINRWNSEFAHRPTPDYFQTFGLGFFEYFQLAEDIGAEPLPILNAGMACQFNSAEVAPVDQLDPYVQDALDLIEFANGDLNSKWGKVRGEMGHPAPFKLKLLGVGNENWGPQYIERLRVFQNAIKQKYPDIKLVTSAGTDPAGERFEFLNGELRKMKADIIDEHFYRRPDWFLQNASRYDNYERNGAKIFAGEYAAQSDRTVSIYNKNNWQTAIAEAAFMTGMERNADVVVMSSYAPLFAHTDGWQWTPDLIWIDNLRSFGTPNYYIQKLFSTNKGTHVIPVLKNSEIIAGKDSLYASATIDKNTSEVIVKMVNTSGQTKMQELTIDGVKKLNPKAVHTILKAGKLEDVNTLNNPAVIQPIDHPIQLKGKKMNVFELPCF